MTEPIRIDLPHQLGTAGARARVDGAMADIERPPQNSPIAAGRATRCS